MDHRDAMRFRAEDIRREDNLADAMRKLPPGQFCAWGGLNPHIASPGELAVCRTCARNENCYQPFKSGVL